MTDPDLPSAADNGLDDPDGLGDLDGSAPGADVDSAPGGLDRDADRERVFRIGDGDVDRGDGGLWATAADDRARAEAFERRLVDLEERLDAAAAPATQPPPAATVRTPRYQALPDFVNEEFCPRYTRRRQGGRWRWCPQWWEHSEAVSRLDALHKAWEAMHDDGPNGMGDWYRNHLDHQLPILMGADGPFRGCAEQHWAADPADDLRTGTPPEDNMAWRVA